MEESVSDIPEMQLQKCANFNVDFKPNLFRQASLMNDPATANLRCCSIIGTRCLQFR